MQLMYVVGRSYWDYLQGRVLTPLHIFDSVFLSTQTHEICSN